MPLLIVELHSDHDPPKGTVVALPEAAVYPDELPLLFCRRGETPMRKVYRRTGALGLSGWPAYVLEEEPDDHP